MFLILFTLVFFIQLGTGTLSRDEHGTIRLDYVVVPLIAFVLDLIVLSIYLVA
jgi:hypothetical protein